MFCFGFGFFPFLKLKGRHKERNELHDSSWNNGNVKRKDFHSQTIHYRHKPNEPFCCFR